MAGSTRPARVKCKSNWKTTESPGKSAALARGSHVLELFWCPRGRRIQPEEKPATPGLDLSIRAAQCRPRKTMAGAVSVAQYAEADAGAPHGSYRAGLIGGCYECRQNLLLQPAARRGSGFPCHHRRGDHHTDYAA